MKITKFFMNFDYVLFFAIIILTIFGIAFIFSSVLNSNKPEIKSKFYKQIIFGLISCVLLIISLFIPIKVLKNNISFILYGICIVGLILTLFLYTTPYGQKRFSIFGFSFQFSEPMKIAVILVLSRFFSNRTRQELKKIHVYLIGLLITGIPMGLIFLQPDLGTLLVYLPILIGMSFLAGIKKRYLLYTVLIILVITLIPIISIINEMYFNNTNKTLYLFTNLNYVVIICVSLAVTMVISILAYLGIFPGINEQFKRIFYWIIFFTSLLLFGFGISYGAKLYIDKNEYQKDRLKTFINPNFDKSGAAYNVTQTKTSIGNGGLLGKGWKKGDHTQKQFIPEKETDFIFPVIAEEAGFIGSLLVIILYSLIFFRGFFAILKVRHYFETYVIIGILSMLFFHIIQNIGMTIGIMPITGIPLPFLSYGGSFLMTCYIGIGLIINLELSRLKF